MEKVFLCEKRAQAQDIAREMGVVKNENGYILVKGNVAITWASGHLVELEDPHEYDPAYKRWAWESLPLQRAQWNYKVIPRYKPQMAVIKGLLKSAKTVVIATDAGREGELIARLIIQHCKYKGPLERLWIRTLTSEGIRSALNSILPGSAKEPLHQAAVARHRSDNVYGLSATRAATLAAKVSSTTFPVGRVQTTVLAMVASRDLAIATFKVEDYFILEAQMLTASGKSLTMRHVPAATARIKTKAEAETLVAKAAKAQGPLQVSKTPGTSKAPLPYSMPTLQRDANKIFGLSAATTLALAQSLYEKKVTTYPRTDCRFLDPTQIPEIPEVLDVVSQSFPDAVSLLKTQGVMVRNSTFDGSQITDHHGIIPTNVLVPLTGAEQQVYSLICQQYLRCLAPDAKFTSTRVTMDANGVQFKATGRITEEAGWQAIKLV